MVSCFVSRKHFVGAPLMREWRCSRAAHRAQPGAPLPGVVPAGAAGSDARAVRQQGAAGAPQHAPSASQPCASGLQASQLVRMQERMLRPLLGRCSVRRLPATSLLQTLCM